MKPKTNLIKVVKKIEKKNESQEFSSTCCDSDPI